MRTDIKTHSGMSLVEATIILMILALLTAVLAPTLGDYVEEARHVKAKEDVEAIGTSLARIVRDTGVPCLTQDAVPTATACTRTNRVELLMSGTAVGLNEPAVTAAVFDPPDLSEVSSDSALNWGGAVTAPANGEIDNAFRDIMDNQLVSNTLTNDDYAGVNFSLGSGPKAGLGWRGPYLSGPVGLDPWGTAYQASALFLSTAPTATGTGEGTLGWSSDVVVISAGPNVSIATPFGGLGTKAIGDDVTYVVRGATR